MDYWLSCGDIASTLGHQQPRYHISIMHCRRTNHQISNGEKWGPLCHREPKQIHSHDSNLISQPKKWVIIFHSSKKKEADVWIFRCFVHKRHYDRFFFFITSQWLKQKISLWIHHGGGTIPAPHLIPPTTASELNFSWRSTIFFPANIGAANIMLTVGLSTVHGKTVQM